MEDNYLETYTGNRIQVIQPVVDNIIIEDIATALSRQVRYAGHTYWPYTIAQHSVLVAENVPKGYRLEALLHDATEAYLMDLPKPVKNVVGKSYEDLEEKYYKVIADTFGLKHTLPKDVKLIDKRIVVDEVRWLMEGGDPHFRIDGVDGLGIRVEPWESTYARDRFLEMFSTYMRR